MVANSSSFMQQPLCHDNESSALLQFKQSFLIDGHASGDPSAYPKVAMWKSHGEGEGSDCCSWDGVECDRETGHVIGLHLASSCLYGSINSSNTLFSLLLRLRSLNLSHSAFAGQIPSELLALSNLVFLDLSANPMLQLQKPSLRNLFSGELPTSIRRLGSLTELDISSCNFTGLVPSPLGHLSQLSYLDLSNNSFSGQIPSFMANLTRLTYLELSLNNFSVGTLAWLDNQLSGQIPSWLMNLTQLTVLDLGANNLEGGIPSSLFELVNLQFLSVAENSLNGTVELNMLLKLKNLTSFQLSGNRLSLLGYNRTNVTLPKFNLLGLDSCNLTEFPDFLRNQDELEVLSLVNNKIHGLIPKLSMLDLDSNMLQGPLPIPPPSTIEYYSVSRNKLTGEISPLICNMSSLILLDLSSNNLSGRIPQCLANLSKSLSVLDLGSNSLDGPIPQTCTMPNNLRVIDLGSWHSNFRFPKLRIVDLSDNKFIGDLPSEYFQNWDAMKLTDIANDLRYMQALPKFQIPGYGWIAQYMYSMTMTNRGM
ncbi:Receptor-like protein 12 [Vitis vinifera]|uniref:Receptor-like protein 12 n=1 Tax=Vitis vinifera TaxID=29760 RepID=A0A438GH02_VITVI|nr:Receptor-like protein 12 [Vitis vinifera]